MSNVPKSTVVPEHLEEFTPEYCQVVFQYFEQHATETATVTDLAAYISAQHRSDEDETAIAISLHHATLPKLADAGLIEYDPRSNTARYSGFQSGNRD
jgi:Mn-dependent DtxR family transcriptional regulator